MASPCGTSGGYHAHYVRGEPICTPCREAYNRYRREHYASSITVRQRISKDNKKWREKHPTYRHGVDPVKLLEKQGGKCGICGKTSSKHWCTDHDHVHCSGNSGCAQCVRGILCGQCNGMLGWYERNEEKIKLYLEKGKSRMDNIELGDFNATCGWCGEPVGEDSPYRAEGFCSAYCWSIARAEADGSLEGQDLWSV